MIIDLKQNSPQWLEYRKSKFNASEAGALMGVGFIKPYELLAIKRGDISDNNFVTPYAKHGIEAEPKLREYLNKNLNLNLKPAVVCSDIDNRFSASLDGVDFDKRVFCEIKFSFDEYSYLLEHKKPSPKYLYQIMHQFYCLDNLVDKCIFCVGASVNLELKIEYIEIERDNTLINELICQWQSFANKLDATNTADTAKLYEIYLKLKDKLQEQKILEAQIKELKAQAIDLSTDEGIKTEFITIYPMKVNRYDYKKHFESLNIAQDDKYMSSSSSMGVRINEKFME